MTNRRATKAVPEDFVDGSESEDDQEPAAKRVTRQQAKKKPAASPSKKAAAVKQEPGGDTETDKDAQLATPKRPPKQQAKKKPAASPRKRKAAVKQEPEDSADEEPQVKTPAKRAPKKQASKKPAAAAGGGGGRDNADLVAQFRALAEHTQHLSEVMPQSEREYTREVLFWKAGAYANAADSLEAFPEPITVNNVRAVNDLRGVGRSTIKRVKSWLATGSISQPHDFEATRAYEQGMAREAASSKKKKPARRA